MCRRRKLDNAEALVAEAHGLLDVERFRVALGSHALLEAFGADLELGRAVPSEHHGEGAGRVKLPSVEFRSGGQVHGVYGPAAYEDYRAAAVAAGAKASADGSAPSVLEALRSWGSMATVEVAEVCGLPGPRAPAALWQAALEWQVKAERVGTGELWSLG
jgi:hypothetical protein